MANKPAEDKAPGVPDTPATNVEDASGGYTADGSRQNDANAQVDAAADTTPGGKDNTKGKKASSKAESLRDRFLELSGYEDSDVIGANAERRTFVTSNGGKYEVSPKGKKLRRLAGPVTPAELEAAEEEEE